jgi:hypothetical protein
MKLTEIGSSWKEDWSKLEQKKNQIFGYEFSGLITNKCFSYRKSVMAGLNTILRNSYYVQNQISYKQAYDALLNKIYFFSYLSSFSLFLSLVSLWLKLDTAPTI